MISKNKKIKEYKKGEGLLSKVEIEKELTKLEGQWNFINNSLILVRKCSNFEDAVALLNRIAVVAEDLGHHPDLAITSYNKLTILLSTHSAGGVTENDILAASEIARILG